MHDVRVVCMYIMLMRQQKAIEMEQQLWNNSGKDFEQYMGERSRLVEAFE